MGKKTGITWTDSTWNPWWGCTKVSAGCTYCYADTLSNRWGLDIWGPKADRRFFGDKHWSEPINWNKKAASAQTRQKVFCASMADVFEGRADLTPHRDRLFLVIESTPWLDWLLLTKRPENILDMIPASWRETPRPNVWMGTSTENQDEADVRIPRLLQVPAVVHFLSAEPLLGPVNLSWFNYSGIDWVITGGESGPHARPMDQAWVESLWQECESYGIAFFHKQMGTVWAKEHGLGAAEHASDPEQWPKHLRVQNFPMVQA